MQNKSKLLAGPVRLLIIGLAVSILMTTRLQSQAKEKELPKSVTRAPIVFSRGRDTEAVDHGRPVVLIAAALGVKTEVFREAFSYVHPAGPGRGGPTDAEARRNKAALMRVLAPFGVTDARLDEVSNFYRYPPGRDNLWKHTAAAGNALIKDGVIIGYEITDAGSGYTVPPTVSVPKFPNAVAKVEISFGKDLAANGSVTAVAIAEKKPQE